ncbi:MAG: helix-turn-helix transcriptional regulator [Treponema sp.]|nr:helix-turn-helix transcriptional regulator [Treponema sp.]
MSIDFFAIGQRIQKKRKSQNITQENLAEAISVTVGYISQIERGITKINLETLSQIAEHLNCDITDFLSNTVIDSNSYLENELSDLVKKLDSSNRKVLIEMAQILQKNQKKR